MPARSQDNARNADTRMIGDVKRQCRRAAKERERSSVSVVAIDAGERPVGVDDLLKRLSIPRHGPQRRDQPDVDLIRQVPRCSNDCRHARYLLNTLGVRIDVANGLLNGARARMFVKNVGDVCGEVRALS